MNPKLEEIALPFSEIQERMFKLHKTESMDVRVRA